MLKLSKKFTAILLMGVLFSVLAALPVSAAPVTLIEKTNFFENLQTDNVAYRLSLPDTLKGYNFNWTYGNDFNQSLPTEVFGKGSTDKSLSFFAATKPTVNGYFFNCVGAQTTYAAGETLVYSWQHAWGLNDNGSGHGISFGFTGGSVSYNYVSISKAGAITVAGANRGTIPNYRKERWYEYQLVIGFTGETKYKLSFYVDGVAYCTDVSITAPSADTGINYFRFLPVNSGETANLAADAYVDAYVDNISALKYPNGESPMDLAVNITSDSSKVITEKFCFVKESMTVEDFIGAVKVNGSGTGFTAALLNESFAAQEGNVSNGYLKITMPDGREIYRDVKTDYLINETFSSNYSPSGPVRPIDGLQTAAGLGGKESTDYAISSTRSSSYTYWDVPTTFGLTGTWTYEFSMYLTNTGLPCPSNFYYSGGYSGTYNMNSFVTANRWSRVAFMIDTENKRVTIYVDGVEKYSATNLSNNGQAITSWRISMGTSGSQVSGTQTFAMDNYKLYPGAYDPAGALAVSAASGDTVMASGSYVGFNEQETMSTGNFLDGLTISGAVKMKIFDNATLTSTALADAAARTGTVAKGQILVLYSAGDEIIKYYEVVKSLDVQPFTWTIPEAGKVAVSVAASSIDPNYPGATLIIAKYSNGMLVEIKMDTKTLSAASVTLSASVEGVQGDDIKAFLWTDKGGLTLIPITNACPYTGQAP